MRTLLKKSLELSKELGKNWKERLKQKANGNKKFTLYLGFLLIVLVFIVVSKFDFEDKAAAEKHYQSKITKMEENAQKLHLLKLNQKADNLGIEKLHQTDASIVDYTQTSFGDITTFLAMDGTGRKAKIPAGKILVVVHKKDGSRFYVYHGHHLQKSEE